MAEGHEDVNPSLLIDIAISQASHLVQDFLRSHDAHIGRTKAHFRANLREAIDNGRLTLDEIGEWLDTVEGWGSQHCYVYRVPQNKSLEESWKDPEAVRKKVAGAGLDHLWDANRHAAFPKVLELATVRFYGNILIFTWQRGYQHERRRADLDKREEISEEQILFKAHSVNPRRLVARFMWHIGARIAGIFIPQSSDYKDYERVRGNIIAELKPVLDITTWSLLDVPMAVRKINAMSREPNGGALSVRSNEAAFSSASTVVTVKSNSQGGNISDDDSVRPVVVAVENTGLPGHVGEFWLKPGDDEMHVTLIAPGQEYSPLGPERR